MKKYFYLFVAAVAMMLTACSSEEVTNDMGNTSKKVAPLAVGFDTYTSNATRAVGGQTDVMTTSTLQSTGFGVFGFHTSNADGTSSPIYDGTTTPNFMYNQQVSYGSSVWTYSPLKYWPNNTLSDSYGATSTPSDAVSFFAYAPYVATGSVGNPGITAFSANTATGDPKVSYTVATKPSESVDLLWGVVPTAWKYKDVAGNTYNSTGAYNLLPLKNLVKPDVDTRMKFLFLHALSRLGVNVIAAVDQQAPGGELDSQTKITIQSVTITETTPTKLMASSAVLNLNNVSAGVANWESRTISSFALTIDDDNELESSLRWGSSKTDTWTNKEGVVTAKEKPLIEGGKYFMLIPTEGVAQLSINIKYTVLTKDVALDGNYSKVDNDITKTVNLQFKNGEAYTLKLILGMTSVKLDAEVQTWAVQDATPVDLPKNNKN